MAFEGFDLFSEGFYLFIDEQNIIYENLKSIAVRALTKLILDENQVVVCLPEGFGRHWLWHVEIYCSQSQGDRMPLARAPDHPKEASRVQRWNRHRVGGWQQRPLHTASVREVPYAQLWDQPALERAPEVPAGLGAAFHQRGLAQARRGTWQGHHALVAPPVAVHLRVPQTGCRSAQPLAVALSGSLVKCNGDKRSIDIITHNLGDIV